MSHPSRAQQHIYRCGSLNWGDKVRIASESKSVEHTQKSTTSTDNNLLRCSSHNVGIKRSSYLGNPAIFYSSPSVSSQGRWIRSFDTTMHTNSTPRLFIWASQLRLAECQRAFSFRTSYNSKGQRSLKPKDRISFDWVGFYSIDSAMPAPGSNKRVKVLL